MRSNYGALFAYLQMALVVLKKKKKPCPPMQETQDTGVLSLDWEDPLEEGMAIHSNILA